jgi:probable lipoprotein NlpC
MFILYSVRVSLRPMFACLLVGSLAGCSVFKPAEPARKPVTLTGRNAPARKPTAKPAVNQAAPKTTGRAAKVPAKPLKVVDTKTYQRTYVPEVVSVARTFTGTPYRTGGVDERGIDCSGLVQSVFQTVGLKLPRISWQQSEIGREVETEEIKPGDLLFFVPEKGKAGYVSHTAIVTEVRGPTDVQFIHASSSRGVREDNLYADYFRNRYVKAVRPF